MTKRVLIILGHPTRERKSFCEALALAYQQGARDAGHEVQLLNIAQLHFDPILHEGYAGDQPLEPDLAAAQDSIRRADHLVFVYPMWEFMMPALLKGFFERTFTRGFAYDQKSKNPLKSGLLTGKSARIIQTMGMPALMYRLMFGQHGARALKSLLGFCGIRDVNISYFGLMAENSERRGKRFIKKVRLLGQAEN